MDKQEYIYKVSDPSDNAVRYIGKTIHPTTRRGQICSGYFVGKQMQWWVDELKETGKRPVFEVIEKCEQGKGSEREKYWIDYYKEQGCDLLNHRGVRSKYY